MNVHLVLYQGDELGELRFVVSVDEEDLGDFPSCLRIECNRATGWPVVVDY